MTTNKIRGFEVVKMKHFKGIASFFEDIQLPTRADVGSAGYDFYSVEDARIEVGGQHTFWTNIKAYMQQDEVLQIYPRSSIGVKLGLVLANTVGIIDSTYYSNQDNDGNIGIVLKNMGTDPVIINAGDRIAQGVFMKYLVADEDNTMSTERIGGFGSSGK